MTEDGEFVSCDLALISEGKQGRDPRYKPLDYHRKGSEEAVVESVSVSVRRRSPWAGEAMSLLGPLQLGKYEMLPVREYMYGG